MYTQNYWVNRSLLYWSRAFDRIGKGDDYGELKRTYHIGILNFSLFPKYSEFYARYKIKNVKKDYEYTDLLDIRVLDLTNIENATLEDSTELICWAKVFKARTVEELESVVKDQEVLANMVATVRKLNDDEKIRQQCEAEFWYEFDRASMFRSGEEQGI